MTDPSSLPKGFGTRDRLVVLGVAVIGLVGLFGGWWLAELRVREAVEAHALALAERVTEAAARILDPSGGGGIAAQDEALREIVIQVLQRTSGVQRMIAYGADGTVWLDSTGAAIGEQYDHDDVGAVLESGAPLMMLHLSGDEHYIFGTEAVESAIAETYVPVRREGMIVGVFEVYVDATESLNQAIHIARITYAVFAGTLLAATSAIIVLVGRSLTRRRRDFAAMDALRRNAEAISAELAAANRRQERFNANAAHEMRTPLAILRARLDAMKEDDDVHALKRDVDGMIHQVELLLELARTESASARADDRIDLAHLAQDLAARLYPMARRAGRDIAVEAPPHAVFVAGDPALMESAVRNLLENALRASPVGATVRLVAAENPSRLAVVDHGPGVDPAELPELTEPFRRGPNSGSAGLGLAIVAEAARRLKAQLSLARTDEAGGATFSLIFPRHGS